MKITKLCIKPCELKLIIQLFNYLFSYYSRNITHLSNSTFDYRSPR